MRATVRRYTPLEEPRLDEGREDAARVLLAFASPELLAARWGELAALAAPGTLVGCSTAGEIAGTDVTDETLVLVDVAFEHTRVQPALSEVAAGGSSAAGSALARALARPGLRHVLVFSDGTQVNGSELVEGLESELPSDVSITGGLAGDGARFARTLVGLDARLDAGLVVALGLYGDRIRVGYGSLGGWDPFGPERVITASEGNRLLELDGEPALDLYKRYLGEHAAELPASALLFPLSVRTGEDDHPVVRTVLGVDETDRSMTFAGDVPRGSLARLMKANFDRLIEGAAGAARVTGATDAETPSLALLVSCVGRRLALAQRADEEVDAVRDVLGGATQLAGFYSYGEIAPFTPGARCELHNQTMTVTTFAEV